MQIQKIPYGFKNVLSLESKLKTKPEEYWVRRGENRALKLFKLMSQRVPAYKDFLKKNNISPDTIKKIEDFKKIPPLDKDNYLRKYSIQELCWDGNFVERRWTISTNSGSTGEPFYFPREKEQDGQYALLAELYLRNNFDIHKKTTLYLDCFAMGAWIGGLFTYEAIRIVAERGKYPLTIYTPGIFKEEILKAVISLGNRFDQVIIGGYPPLVKDVIDEGASLGVDWKKYNLGFIFSAEGFTEEFRNYIYERAKIKDYFKRSLNHYGTADMGTMAHETPLTILVRVLLNEHPKITPRIFPETNRLPTLTQYFPELFYFEENNNVLFCTGWSGIPFVRYNLKDYGGIIGYVELTRKFNEEGIYLDKRLTEMNIQVWKLPFVYLYERKDFVVKLYGANIFPDTIRHALQQSHFEEYITSKFTLMIKYNKNQNQFLEINVELKKGITKTDSLAKKIKIEVVKSLLQENSEYTSNYRALRERQEPVVLLWPYEYPEFFKSGGKQKWIKSEPSIEK
ncbi:MAG: hypothetical protein UT39_C0012G0058 [Candidatus Woesebacteria bacterium GW2011_GWA1_39_21]|uniref:Phenylacetate-CoA ligase n=1 Tax=Candidatus Woesebacteria bacterium GW2011_GWA1_39_21 TaxID=1618550 RepID=A0A0G0NDY6_9BACT|nr:MAG: hypothetical protein UT39_C0012G0058 [Candidatus Woesebacteria bacterium GW2011_GWA1_39_21]